MYGRMRNCRPIEHMGHGLEPGAVTPTTMYDHPKFREGFALLEKYNLSFEVRFHLHGMRILASEDAAESTRAWRKK